MPGLEPLHEKLADVLGLALAAPAAIAAVEERVDDAALLRRLHLLRADAERVQQRCAEIAAGWGDEARWDVQGHAVSVQRKAGELLYAWVKAGTDTAQRYAFLAMAEAGEVAATAALAVLGRGDGEIDELVAWALPLQESHLEAALEGCTAAAAALAAARQPSA